jgi:hypothetical protein
MLERSIGWICACLIVACFFGNSPLPVRAESLQSDNYRFDESTIGAGGLVQSNSANFQANSSIGEVAIGESSSANFQVGAGSQTTHEPTLSFKLINSAANFGSFTASDPTVASSKFSVAKYTSYGYVVQIVGQPPTNGSHVIDAMTATATSTPGVEQFGINLVANTEPASIGANPDHGGFGFGSPSTNYGTPNQFRFVSGETIASAPKSSGETIYTMSYLVNVGSLTPGGLYNSKQTLVVTGTY